ncbi:hypothetical protein ACF09I_29025 [Streptomyces sp. NPDC014940]|uniref:hypothetical protein n=1 Tax=Streptomyces sp. NPDC014940 TaxID=3364932 RepID=UPI0036F6102E
MPEITATAFNGIGMQSIGMRSVVWLIAPEILPLSVRGPATSSSMIPRSGWTGRVPWAGEAVTAGVPDNGCNAPRVTAGAFMAETWPGRRDE